VTPTLGPSGGDPVGTDRVGKGNDNSDGNDGNAGGSVWTGVGEGCLAG
jgi:hypothetical protein